MNVSEALNAAADIIERDGWNQGGYAPDQIKHGTPLTGLPVCAMGAIYQSLGAPIRWDAPLGCWYGFSEFGDELHAADALAEHLDVGDGRSLDGIPFWNDSRERTATEVIEALRAAAVIAAANETDVRVVAPLPSRVSA